ncbi:MAG: SusC/RagA family TonB-linked outer membrane protein [Bacteroidetes bacterium]|nr:SusC/RagA family TonB-linked outer membrane protein [Bacteroidota bacterium]
MKRKRLLVGMLIPILLLLTNSLFAQTKAITGKVTDSNGNPLSGVSVIPKGALGGTVTGPDGVFKINVNPQTIALDFSFIGYATQELAIGNGNLQVKLVPSTSSLGEVVVIGYGAVKKKNLTGAVSSIGSKDFNEGLSTTPEQLIAGKVAGVTITPNGGQPGQGSVIRIRQGASLNASNDPLIVIDGVPVTGGLKGDGTGQNSGISNPLSLINPDDIESFSVLKDAASAAIYGSRASNGVILITTKKGKSGKPVITFSTQFSGSEASKKVDVLSTSQFRQMINTYGSSSQQAEMGAASTNWQDQIFQTGIGTNNNIGIAGSMKSIKMPYRLTLNYNDQSGILKTDNLERYTAGLHLTPVLLKDHLKVDININAAQVNTRFANQGAIGSAIAMDPTQPVYLKGSQFGGYNEYTTLVTTTGGGSYLKPRALATQNPLALLEQKFDKGHTQKLYGNVQFDYKIPFIPDLHANLNLGYEGQKGYGHVDEGTDAAQAWATGTTSGLGYHSKYLQKVNNSTLEFYLNYNKNISAIKSNINATAGYGYYDYLTVNYNYPNFYSSGDTIPGSQPTFPFDKPRFTLLSYYARLIYTLEDKYILAASIRTDGSSRFAPANRFGVFPSLALTWRMQQENFLKNSNVVSTLNVRASYGVTGNQDGIGLYNYLPFYNYSTITSLYQIGDSFYHVYAPNGYNANIKWEQTATTNLGVDFGFLKNRINGSVDVYDKQTTNLLNTVNVTPGTNFANQITANVGSMETKGIEVLLNLVPISTKRISWDVGFNWAYNHREITNLTLFNDPRYIGVLTGGISGGTGSTIQIHAVGHEPNAFYVEKQIYDPKTNKPIEGLYEDLNRDGKIDQNDFYVSKKSPYPVAIFGFNTSFRVDRWTISTVLHGNIGNYVYNNEASSQGFANALFNNSAVTLQNINPSVYNTGFVTRQLFSDYYLENASFLKMDNVTLSYNAGKINHGKVGLRVAGTVQNVFTITKYTGLNPEIFSGIDNNLYPIPRMVVLSANLTF